MSDEKSLKDRVTRQGEEAIGKLAQELLENPMVTSALSAAFETRERAMRAQEVAMGALNLPSASDLERLTRRVRSVSQRLEGIEDGLDRLDGRIESARPAGSTDERLTKIEATLERLESALARPRSAPAGSPRGQSRAPQAKPRSAGPRSSAQGKPRASGGRAKSTGPQSKGARGSTRRPGSAGS